MVPATDAQNIKKPHCGGFGMHIGVGGDPDYGDY